MAIKILNDLITNHDAFLPNKQLCLKNLKDYQEKFQEQKKRLEINPLLYQKQFFFPGRYLWDSRLDK